jgi:serine protease Do|tara:strand:- start:1689 stop:2384 length:696 start_codon:yes stop_codon:yes gene_type:complete
MSSISRLVLYLVLSTAILVTTPLARAEVGFVGMQVQGIGECAAAALGHKTTGVLVKDVAVGEAAAMAGFRRGDLIVKFDRKNIKKFDDLIAAVIKTTPGKKVSVIVIRAGKRHSLSMRLGKRPASWQVKKAGFRNYPEIGFTVSAINQKIREQFSLPWGAVGLVVTLVDKNGKVTSGLAPGDVIVQANLKDIWEPSQLTRQIETARKKKLPGILILIESARGFRYSVLPVN